MSKSNKGTQAVAQVEDNQVGSDQVAQVENTESVVEPILSELMTEHKTKSGVIRYLAAQGWARGRIAKFMNIKYQHVRQVLITPLANKKVGE